MRKLLNILFINSEDVYATLDGENIIINREKKQIARFPLHTLEGIVSFSYAGASPALVGACIKKGIFISFCTQNGKFLYRGSGMTSGNVLLRREQYRIADDEVRSACIGRNFIFGKVYNSRYRLSRMLRDHALRIDVNKFREVLSELKIYLNKIYYCNNLDDLRGYEGSSANLDFSCFDDMILNDKENFYFHGRNRRPPKDNINALLSFSYMLLALDCTSALECVGLDSAVGFVHRDRPGRKSLALDLMEELRPYIVDRFILTLVNNRILKGEDFKIESNGGVILKDNARKLFLQQWMLHKKEEIIHPYLKEKIPRGLVSYVQAVLLARYIRGDIDGYPPFLWKG